MSLVIDEMKKSASAIFGKVETLANLIRSIILSMEEITLKESWKVPKVCTNRLLQWIELVSSYGATLDFTESNIKQFLYNLFQCQQTNLIKESGVLLPLYSLAAACGKFSEGQNPEQMGWVSCSIKGVRLNKLTHFVMKALGRSMEPRIHDGDYCVFTREQAQDGDIVLVQQTQYDEDYGGCYTIKKIKTPFELIPLNVKEYKPIRPSPSRRNEYKIIGKFCDVVHPQTVI